ncbi:MAG: type II toxin-antitoxin system VapC family toxin [Candidatus Njordarchaeota archaeon]
MRDNVVLDSSVIAAIYFTDPYSDWASSIVKLCRECYTLDIAYVEIGNVAWKRIHIFGQPEEAILLGLKSAIRFIDNVCLVVDSRSIIEEAINLALEEEIAVYDALFVYLAKKNNASLATLDKKLISKLKNTKYGSIVVHPY